MPPKTKDTSSPSSCRSTRQKTRASSTTVSHHTRASANPPVTESGDISDLDISEHSGLEYNNKRARMENPDVSDSHSSETISQNSSSPGHGPATLSIAPSGPAAATLSSAVPAGTSVTTDPHVALDDAVGTPISGWDPSDDERNDDQPPVATTDLAPQHLHDRATHVTDGNRVQSLPSQVPHHVPAPVAHTTQVQQPLIAQGGQPPSLPTTHAIQVVPAQPVIAHPVTTHLPQVLPGQLPQVFAPQAAQETTLPPELVQNIPGGQVPPGIEQTNIIIAQPQDTNQPLDVNPEPIPALANAHPEFVKVNYIPFPVLERAMAFALKDDPINNRFAISRVPPSAKWGSSATTDRVLCYNDRPITIWFVGSVVTTWFTNAAGQPQLRVNIGIRLPHLNDAVYARNMYKRSRPERAYNQDVFYASKYMGRQTRGCAEITPLLFQDVYDAQHRFRAKREMSLIPPAYISKNDLVLVEAAFTRWKSAKDKKNNRDWSLWDVGFELQAISLLYEAPAAAQDHDYGANDNIRDDM